MESSDTKEKQDYLKKEILDKGYDRQEFAEFMMAQKEDGLNVENWDLRDLLMTVDQFVETHKHTLAEEADPYQQVPSTQDYDNNEYPNEGYDDEYNDSGREPGYGDTYYNPEPEQKQEPKVEETKQPELASKASSKIRDLENIQQEERKKIIAKEKEEEEKYEKKKKKAEKSKKKKSKHVSKKDKNLKKVSILFIFRMISYCFNNKYLGGKRRTRY
jgi:hypothetical protein